MLPLGYRHARSLSVSVVNIGRNGPAASSRAAPEDRTANIRACLKFDREVDDGA